MGLSARFWKSPGRWSNKEKAPVAEGLPFRTTVSARLSSRPYFLRGRAIELMLKACLLANGSVRFSSQTTATDAISELFDKVRTIVMEK
jgi:hypothetical protein